MGAAVGHATSDKVCQYFPARMKYSPKNGSWHLVMVFRVIMLYNVIIALSIPM